jgi:hypothetical protein
MKRNNQELLPAIGVITGDIVGSRGADAGRWMPVLTAGLSKWGQAKKDWAIYRGDSFTLTVPAGQILLAALQLKAALIGSGGVNVRLGLGVGSLTFRAPEVTQSQGSAFERSGEAFDALQRKSLKLMTGDAAWDADWEVMLAFAMRIADHWTEAEASALEVALTHPEWTQGEWAEALSKSQSTVSATLKRACLDEFMALLRLFTQRIAS